MKEAYFQLNNLEFLSSQWLEKFGRPKKILRQPFKIQDACLLILDMQRYFLDESSHAWVPSGKAIIPGLNKAARYFRDAGRPVIISIGEQEENRIGSNCGQYVQKHILESGGLTEGYTYHVTQPVSNSE